MARLDPSRTALELDEVELTVANLLLTSPDDELLSTPVSVKAVAELERAGIAEDGVIGGYAARILAVVLDPELRLIVERFAAIETQRDIAARRGAFGVWGESRPNGATEFTPVEPDLIPWAVARAVGLGPRERPALARELELRASAFTAALGQLAQGDVPGAGRVLEQDGGLDEIQRAALLELLAQRRLSWRAFSLWTDTDGLEQTAAVAVVDGGDSGLWLSQHLDAESADPFIRLTPTEPSVVWEGIVSLVPSPASITVAGDG